MQVAWREKIDCWPNTGVNMLLLAGSSCSIAAAGRQAFGQVVAMLLPRAHQSDDLSFRPNGMSKDLGWCCRACHRHRGKA